MVVRAWDYGGYTLDFAMDEEVDLGGVSLAQEAVWHDMLGEVVSLFVTS